VGVFLGFGVLALLALVAVNMLILLVSGWVLLYGGIFFLGFGGARWTSDLAISYYKTVLGVAASLFAMVLIVGVATSIIDQYYRSMAADIQVKELAVVMMVAFIMAMLVKSTPPLISGIITGASINQAGSMGFGAGAIVGAAGMAVAAVATGSAAIAAGASNMASGTQALMAAYRKASEAGSMSGDALTDVMPFKPSGNNAFGSGNVNNGTSLASVMGDSTASMASNFGSDSRSQARRNTGAGTRSSRDSRVANRDAHGTEHSLNQSAATGHAGHTGTAPGTEDVFEKNYFAEGEADFDSMAPEIRDFVNRSHSSS
jgi:type IV secretory pathway TrbL component